MPLTLDHVSYIYQAGTPYESSALEDVSLEIGDGEYIAVVGRTGSGKSTLVQLMNGLLKPCSGTVCLDGRNIHEKGYPLRSVRCQVGLVFQYPETQLFEETVEKDIAFAPKNFGLSDEEVHGRVLEAMAWVGLDETFLDLSPFELSGGNVRRCALAGILAMHPRFLVLDEPTAGLDPAGKEQILSMIGDRHREGTGIVMVTHNMDDAAAWADRIIVMERGRVLMDGKPSEVFSRREEIRNSGLDVPLYASIGSILREKGIPFPEDVFRADDAFSALLNLLTGKGGSDHA